MKLQLPMHTAMLKKLRTNPITDQKRFELIRTPVRTCVMSAAMQPEEQAFPAALAGHAVSQLELKSPHT